MNLLRNRIVNFTKREDGPTAVEYAVMLALIVAGCMTAVQALGGSSEGSFNASSTAFNGVGSGSSFVAARGSLTSPDGSLNFNPATGAVTDTQTGQELGEIHGSHRAERREARALQRDGWTVNP
jgi:pilus assembly protein Flp/PilA